MIKWGGPVIHLWDLDRPTGPGPCNKLSPWLKTCRMPVSGLAAPAEKPFFPFWHWTWMLRSNSVSHPLYLPQSLWIGIRISWFRNWMEKESSPSPLCINFQTRGDMHERSFGISLPPQIKCFLWQCWKKTLNATDLLGKKLGKESWRMYFL